MADGGAFIDPELAGAAARMHEDLRYFAARFLTIRGKDGSTGVLRFNRAQQFIHERLEQQLAQTGRVRAVIVKGRQLGSSTYVQARFYWRLWRASQPLRAYILTHEEEASANLFAMAQNFQAGLNAIGLAPRTEAASAKELRFDGGAGYKVATAGNRAAGRSSTIQLFHASEAAYWPNDAEHIAGSVQAVGDMPGTEIIFESTANGVGNVFYRYAIAGSRGESDYQTIFVPWFWGEDYSRSCPDGWECSTEWRDYANAHQLTWEQLYWAWRKNEALASAIGSSLDEPCWKFRQEYPATLDEAFQTSGNSFIPGASVLAARKVRPDVIASGPIIMGVDCSRVRDKVGIIDRRGRRVGALVCERMDPGGSGVFVAQQVAAIIRRIRPAIVNIDVGAEGTIYDLLCEFDLGCIINPVNFGSKPIGRGPTGDRSYANRRAEMYDNLREWLAQELPVQIPDDDGLHTDLTAAQWGPGATRYNAVNGELLLESKDAIKARLGSSPDLGDALALTFAVPGGDIPHGKETYTPRDRIRANRRTGY